MPPKSNSRTVSRNLKKSHMVNNNLKVLCLLDVLGFENIFKSKGLHSVATSYKKLTDFVNDQTGGVDIVPVGGFVATGWLVIGNAYFSDSILFWTDYNQISLPSFTNLISEAICFGLENELPVRGTMVVGEMILDKTSNTYLGLPLIEAARTERIQKWIGVSFGQSFTQPAFNNNFHLDTLLPYKSHYKEKENPLATGMTVDWARKWRETRKSDVRPLIQELNKDEMYFDYYTNTLKFVDFSETNHDWFKLGKHLNYG
jgi:hypothetical protein